MLPGFGVDQEMAAPIARAEADDRYLRGAIAIFIDKNLAALVDVDADRTKSLVLSHEALAW